MASTGQKQMGWGWIFFFTYLFFPVGIYLTVRKLHRETTRYTANAGVTLVIGILFAFIGIFYVFMAATGNVEAEQASDLVFGSVTMLLVCGGIGIGLILQARKYRRLGKLSDLYMLYYPHIRRSVDGDLGKLGAVMGRPREQVIRELQMLIETGRLQESAVNTVIGKLESPLLGTAPELVFRAQNQPPRTKKVVCPHCGGSGTVTVGAYNTCEYCDCPIE